MAKAGSLALVEFPGLNTVLREPFDIPPGTAKGFGEAWSAGENNMVIDLVVIDDDYSD
jgi:hypothetical protein